MQARYPMIRQKFQFVPEVQKGDRVEGSWMCQATSARRLNTGIEIFRQEIGDVIKQGGRLM